MRRLDPEGEVFLREAFARLADALERRGLPPHVEPEESLAPWPPGVLVDMPYWVFEHLGDALAETWTDLPSDRYARRGIALTELRSHLLAHASTSGFYLPRAFEHPLHAEGGEPPLPGGLVGSSAKLLEELESLRIPLGVADEPSEDGADLLRSGWRTLHTAATISVTHGTAIWFQ